MRPAIRPDTRALLGSRDRSGGRRRCRWRTGHTVAEGASWLALSVRLRLAASRAQPVDQRQDGLVQIPAGQRANVLVRSEEHTSELQSLMRISYAVFCLKKKKSENTQTTRYATHNMLT